MRQILWTFVVLSPLLALAQNDPSALSPRHAAHLAQTATEKMSALVHAIQTLLT